MDWDGGVGVYSSAGTSSMADELASTSASTMMDLPSARKRKLFGSSGGANLNSPPKLSLVSKSPPLGRPLAGSKRARMAHSHPLARSASSSYATAGSPTRQSPIQAPLQLASGGGSTTTTSYRQRSPSPGLRAPALPRSVSTGSMPRQYAYSPPAAPSLDSSATCIACRRTATSVLQLSKFQKCALCAGTCCPVCIRTCQGVTATREEDSHLSASRKARRHEVEAQPDQPLMQHLRSESPDLGNDLCPSSTSCGAVVCRGCSSESHDGIAQCYRCSAVPPQ